MANRPSGAPAARLLLSHTGELELTDAQVVRLAAIERRAEGRRKALRVAMDSARSRFGGQPGDSVARRQFGQRMRTDLQRVGEQSRVDQRDAIAVLTPDQQAKAWELVSNRGRGMRGEAGQMRPMRGMNPRRELRGMRERRRPDEMPRDERRMAPRRAPL